MKRYHKQEILFLLEVWQQFDPKCHQFPSYVLYPSDFSLISFIFPPFILAILLVFSNCFMFTLTNGAAMMLLEKQYPLWKSKIKAKPKNKCPWQLFRFLYFMWSFQSQGYFSNSTIVGFGCAPQFDSEYLHFEKTPWANDLSHQGPPVANSEQSLVESFEDTLQETPPQKKKKKKK